MATIGIDTFNFWTGFRYSVLDVIKSFEKTTGKRIPYIITDRRQGDIDICYVDATKVFKELGWKAEKSLADMCRDAWRCQINNPNGYDNENKVVLGEIAVSREEWKNNS